MTHRALIHQMLEALKKAADTTYSDTCLEQFKAAITAAREYLAAPEQPVEETHCPHGVLVEKYCWNCESEVDDHLDDSCPTCGEYGGTSCGAVDCGLLTDPLAVQHAELAAPEQSEPDTRCKVKLGSQYGSNLAGHWFYLHPADKYAEAAMAKHSGIAAEQAQPVNQMLLEALRNAEAALSDIGDADRESGDDVAWCEARAAQAIPKARAAITAAQKEVK